MFKLHPYKARWGDYEPYHTLCSFTALPHSHNTCGPHRWRGIRVLRLFFDNQPQNNDNLIAERQLFWARFGPSVISEPVLAQCSQPFLNIKKNKQTCRHTPLSLALFPVRINTPIQQFVSLREKKYHFVLLKKAVW